MQLGQAASSRTRTQVGMEGILQLETKEVVLLTTELVCAEGLWVQSDSFLSIPPSGFTQRRKHHLTQIPKLSVCGPIRQPSTCMVGHIHVTQVFWKEYLSS